LKFDPAAEPLLLWRRRLFGGMAPLRFAIPSFRISAWHSGNSAPQIAHAFYCYWKIGCCLLTPPARRPPQMASAHSTWTRNERIRQVIEGRRHLGQQVMEIVFLSREPLSPADAESHLGAVVGDVLVLREPEKL
jgi:hypothetical protein